MAKNDVVVRSAADLERKYNFAALLGLKKNVEITAQGMQKLENELNLMLNALVINLKDVLDNQSEVSLWFYSGIPTTKNEPYTLWSNPNDHIGDIYYDKNSGYVYQWKNVWEVVTHPDLIEAMAITNSETDTSEDHERKVFFTTPTPPYSNGDWWIKEDGDLFICQISKKEGSYEAIDFIDSSNYVESVIEKIGEEIKVLKGTLTIISENYAKFTDLATGGSTIICGDNIKTGSIQSQNYSKDKSGMKIALENGTIDSKYFKTDTEGKITSTGGKIGGFSLGTESFSANISTTYNFTLNDVNKVNDYIYGRTTLTDAELLKYDVNGDGAVNKIDYLIMQRMYYGYTSKTISGTLEINSKETLRALVLKDSNGKIQTSVGLNGIQTPNLAIDSIPIQSTISYNTGSQGEKVGRWRDDKPIYRRVVTYSFAVENGTSFAHYIENIDEITKFEFLFKMGNEYYSQLTALDTGAVLTAKINKTNITFVGNDHWTQQDGREWIFVVEYTKTTD